ncbi:MAG: DNA primase DnaG [Nanoarchaeota archaeon]
MGKISPIANKYIIHSSIQVDGVVDRPDVIGAIFGQTEGLLGEDLELRELQRSGRIGRIEVNLETSYGKTKGKIIIPSSLDKSETAIVGAALEIIQRIGPCNAKISVDSVEDVRVLKRNYVVKRAKELLKVLMDSSMPDSQELSEEVAHSVRVMEIQTYGKEKLPAGPAIEESDEIIVVEGRADVLSLLKNGFKNAIAMNGSSVPETVIELCKRKTVIAFLDGDRGGILNFQELVNVTEIDFVTMAPDGKEVEELTKKEVHKALRAKITAEQALMDFQKKGSLNASMGNGNSKDNGRNSGNSSGNRSSSSSQRSQQQSSPQKNDRRSSPARPSAPSAPAPQSASRATQHEKDVFRNFSEDLIGTRGAYILDEKLSILGKVPLSELSSTIKSMKSGIFAIVFDGEVTQDIVKTSESINIKYIVGMDSKVDATKSRVTVMTVNEL